MASPRRAGTSLVAALLLASLSVAGLVVDAHRHEAAAIAVADGGVDAAAHRHADGTSHLARFRFEETSPCLACLLRQSQRAERGVCLAARPQDPGGAAPAGERLLAPSGGAFRLPGSRAPPIA
ncbi:MAG: hypothetical protein R3190_15520 [Thermoanaerobaculia bacterium]|nr:hypothetical protein [Thermoanaerobaculia bacterium]